MARHEIRGAAGTLTLNANITSVSATCQANGVVAGFPSGAVYPFVVTIDDERILCAGLTGSSPATITFATRGYDGTTAASHTANAEITHGLAGVEIDDLLDHVYDLSRDDHLEYLTEARHEATPHTTDMYGTGSIDNSALGDDVVDGRVIADDAVDTQHLADDAVEAAQLATNSVTADAIAADAVGTAEIAAGAVDTVELANNAVTTLKIASDAVGTDELQADCVTDNKLADDAVLANHIVDGAVDPTKLSFEIKSGQFVGSTGPGGSFTTTFGHTFATAPLVLVSLADNLTQVAAVAYPPTTVSFQCFIRDVVTGGLLAGTLTRVSWLAISDF